jgi:hypothetical protein
MRFSVQARLLWLAVGVGLGVPEATAQTAPSAPACKACRDTGCVPCGKHGKLLLVETAADVQHCSVAIECKLCSGTLALDCRACNHPTSSQDLAARQQLAADWLQRRRQTVDALTARDPYLHLQTTHFDLASTLAPATIDKEKLDAHARLHRYGVRLQALRAAFVQTFELTDADLPDRMLVVLSEQQRDHGVVGPRLTGMGTANSVGLKLMGPEFVYSMWPDRRTLPDDDAVHRNVLHNVTHLLLSQMRPALFLGNKQHGWLDEGIAHWFEDKLGGKCTNYCFEEVLLQAGAGFAGGKWRPAVRKLLDDGKLPAFAAFASRQTDELTFVEHAAAFAAVDFLLATHGGGKCRDFLRAIKGGQATRDALTVAFGLNSLSFDAAFHPWIKSHYSLVAPR